MTETEAQHTTKDLFVVFGGRVIDTRGRDFADPRNLDVCGFFESREQAVDAWRAASQRHVDDAFTKYVIVKVW